MQEFKMKKLRGERIQKVTLWMHEIFREGGGHERKRLFGISVTAEPNTLVLPLSREENRGLSSVGAILETSLSVKNKGM